MNLDPINGQISIVRRWLFASAGVACVALGAIGVFLPLMPTVIFLLAACYFFGRSIPRLERVLVRNQFFAKFLPLLDKRHRMTNKTKAMILTFIWGGSLISCTALLGYGMISPWLFAIIIPVNAIATYYIVRS